MIWCIELEVPLVPGRTTPGHATHLTHLHLHLHRREVDKCASTTFQLYVAARPGMGMSDDFETYTMVYYFNLLIIFIFLPLPGT